MIQAETPFPYVGSYALFADPNLPLGQQRAELVRIQRRDDERVWVSFPLRIGASGNKIVDLDQLIDGTPLDTAEKREHADLERHLRGRTKLTQKMREQAVRSEILRRRAIYSMVMHSERAKLASSQARKQPSIGGMIPRSEAA